MIIWRDDNILHHKLAYTGIIYSTYGVANDSDNDNICA